MIEKERMSEKLRESVIEKERKRMVSDRVCV